MKTENLQMVQDAAHPAAQRLLIVQLRTHQWQPQKRDRDATEEVARAHNTASDEIGRFNKQLVKRGSYLPLTKARTEVTKFHERMTAQWSFKGQRLLPCDLLMEYKRGIKPLMDAFNAECDKFCNEVYAKEVDERRQELNGLFKPSDYPHPNEIRSKFGITFDMLPLPNADDAYNLVGLGNEDAEEIAEEVRRATAEAINASHAAVVEELVTRAREFITKCEAYSKKVRSTKGLRGGGLRETAIENLRDMIAVVSKGLNVTADTQLDELCAELDAAIKGADVEELRKDTRKRNAKVRAVKNTLDKFQGVF